MKNKNIVFYVAVFFIFLFFTFTALSMISFLVPLDSKENAVSVRVEIPSGTSTKRISEILAENNLIRSKLLFYFAARYPFVFGGKLNFSLKSGVYSLNTNMSMKDILIIIDSGKQEFIKVSFPEGLTARKIASILDKNKVCIFDDFMNAVKSKDLLNKYGIIAESFEGFLFPDTYFFNPSMNGLDVVEMMVKNFFSKIKQISQLDSKNVSEFYDDIILASIVEREYRVASEAPLIASVFKNRIEDGVGLYSCATIEYIITEIQGKPHPDVITYEDLKINSPYNTYKWAGLTPTPISNPGLVALDAAVNTPKTDYYYFTLTDASKGIHTFSKSFKSHTKAGIQYKTKKSAVYN